MQGKNAKKKIGEAAKRCTTSHERKNGGATDVKRLTSRSIVQKKDIVSFGEWTKRLSMKGKNEYTETPSFSTLCTRDIHDAVSRTVQSQ